MDFGFTASEATWFGRWHTRSGARTWRPGGDGMRAACSTAGSADELPQVDPLPLHAPSPDLTHTRTQTKPIIINTRAEFAKEKRKTYSFFLLTDELAAAQSSGGPKTLMYRVK